MSKIRITIGSLMMEAELFDSPTAAKIKEALPFETAFHTWGDEIYFTIPVISSLEETAREEVGVGDLGYWPTGEAFCIFFGPTPMSREGKIIPASAVNIIGRIIGDATLFKRVMNENRVMVEMI